jgi:hypothetical protein
MRFGQSPIAPRVIRGKTGYPTNGEADSSKIGFLTRDKSGRPRDCPMKVEGRLGTAFAVDESAAGMSQAEGWPHIANGVRGSRPISVRFATCVFRPGNDRITTI